jgi:hypothetical protein
MEKDFSFLNDREAHERCRYVRSSPIQEYSLLKGKENYILSNEESTSQKNYKNANPIVMFTRPEQRG